MKRGDAQTIEFRVPLKPDEEKVVTYTVHYAPGDFMTNHKPIMVGLGPIALLSFFLAASPNQTAMTRPD